MSFAQGAPTQPLVLQGSNVFLYGSSTAGNAFTVQQQSAGNVASFVTSTGATGLIVNPTGLVGIGKTNPGYALDVTGDLNFTGTFRQNGTPYIGSQWTGTTSLYFVGNVGINTTSVANPLTVGGLISTTGLAVNQTSVLPTSQAAWFGWNRAGCVVNGATAFMNQQGGGSGGWEFVNYNNSNQLTANCAFLSAVGGLTLGAYSNVSTAPTGGIICPGNVGIGTASPSYLLDVNGQSRIGNPALITDASTALRMTTSGGAAYFQAGTALTSGSVADIVFTGIFATPEFMRIKSTGNVGIATAANINSPLVVYNPASTSTYTGTTAWGNIHLMPQGTNNSWAGITFGGSSGGTIQQSTQASITVDSNSTVGTNMRFNVGYLFANGATERLTILGQTGYVGIGTTNPTYPLCVARTGNTPAIMTTNGAGPYSSGPRIQTYDLVANGQAWMGLGTDMGGNSYEHSLYFSYASNTGRCTIGTYDGTTYSTKVTILSTGNVGIGTASPGTTLDVNGSMNAQNFAQPTFTNQQYTTITTATSMAAATYGSAGGITISKTASGTTTWDACAYSNQSYKYGAYCSARAAQTSAYVMWGLSANQTATNLSTIAYASINYAWYFEATGTLYIYENGTQITTYGTYNVTTSCSITFDGSNIIYWKDGVAVRTVARAVGSPLFFMCTPYNSGGSTIYDVQFGEKGNPYNPGQVITASTGMFSNTVIACKTGALHSTGEAPGFHALMAFAPDGASGNSSIWMGFDPTNDCGYINSARSGQIRPIAIQTRGGNVGIGITNPTSYTLQVAGTIGASGDITALYSDERLKTKTGTLTGALDKVCSLETFTYRNNELAQSFGFKDDYQRVGVSAQQVQKVLPEAVRPAPFDAENQSGQNYLTVQYEKLVPLLIEALKEERAARLALEEKLGLK